MKVPVRKCLFTLKISIVLILVLTVLGLFEFWRGGRRKVGAFAVYGADSPEAEYERLIAEDEAKIIPGLGEGGLPAYLMGKDRILGDESLKTLAINVHLSDRISYNRTLKDVRNDACERVIYSAELPSVSVVIIFHNEPYSVILRTVWSVLNSVRREHHWYYNANYIDSNGSRMNLGYKGQDLSDSYLYIKEIILVDDNSTLPELKGKLSHYVNTRMPNFIKILRLPERRGLMMARMTGARAARGSVLLFLDAHCEVQPDWLRPLIQRVNEKRDAIVSPVIDVINQETFELDAADYFQIGGFTFDGHFNWIEIPSWEKERRGSDISPTWSPTMAGGLFAVDRAYFWSIGGYDEQMTGWGGENLEMSFRTWQCGGTIEIIPCSRVGHIFRAFHPYGAVADSHAVNTARAASVWMDDYAELYYLSRPDLRNNPTIGDLTHRKILREKLKCKSFDWYLQNVYREKYVPVRDSIAFGRFRNPITGLCLDSLQSQTSPAPLGLYPCHGSLQASQQYSLSHSGQLRDEQLCVTVPNSREDKARRIVMTTCHEGAKSQEWRLLDSGLIRHEYTGLCLSADSPNKDKPSLRPCNNEEKQKWTQDLRITRDGELFFDSNIISASQMEKLKHLPKLSRLSRSLPQKYSYDNDHADEPENLPNNNPTFRETTDRGLTPNPSLVTWNKSPVSTFRAYPEELQNGEIKHRTKKKTRNNFLLKILRSLPNGTEQHLEMSIFCKHLKLFPNNSFVRDLVTMFNKYNITVINKGRIFERNRVVALTGHDRSRLKRTRFEKIDLQSDGPVKTTTSADQTDGSLNDKTMETTTTEMPKTTKKVKSVKRKAKRKKSKKHTIQPVSHSLESTSPVWRRESSSGERRRDREIKAKVRALRSKARSLLKRGNIRASDLTDTDDNFEIDSMNTRRRPKNVVEDTNKNEKYLDKSLENDSADHKRKKFNMPEFPRNGISSKDSRRKEKYLDKSLDNDSADRKRMKTNNAAEKASIDSRKNGKYLDKSLETDSAEHKRMKTNMVVERALKGSKKSEKYLDNSLENNSGDRKRKKAILAEERASKDSRKSGKYFDKSLENDSADRKRSKTNTAEQRALKDSSKNEKNLDKYIYLENDSTNPKRKQLRIHSGGKIRLLSLDLPEKQHDITLYVDDKSNGSSTTEPQDLQRAYDELKNYQVDHNRRRLVFKKDADEDGEVTEGLETDRIGNMRVNLQPNETKATEVEYEVIATEENNDKDGKRAFEPKNKTKVTRLPIIFAVSMQNEDDDSNEED